MRTTCRTQNGVRICHLNFSNMPTEAEALVTITEAKAVIAAEKPGTVYTITDVTGSRVTSKIRAALHDLTAHNKPYVKFGAVVGLTNIQRVILTGIIQLTGRRLVAASSMDDAVKAILVEAGRTRA